MVGEDWVYVSALCADEVGSEDLNSENPKYFERGMS
jgi:hypothetical protein